ncbi:MAG: hypothetical protein A2539_04745 [Elusimicrobia bacterium RIFOXYD2_FULL_34_15]|nr:MAG: hypothetical protein A2539_04745 [Elusimicrobia bacterium RIFOXYD2_FULL_34_15]
MKTDTIIIGGGIAGLSTAYHLKNKDFLLLEKESEVGGICRSIKTDNGFYYDYTGHLLHIKTDYAKSLIKKLLKNNLKLISRNSSIYSNNTLTRYPFQANLYGLPKNIIEECIKGLVELKLKNFRSSPLNPHLSFYDFCLNTFGTGISKYFMIPYNEKLWQTNLKKLTTEWMGNYIPKPSLTEVIAGATTDNKKNIGYNATFYYPQKGGIQSLIDAIENEIPKTKIKTNCNIISIDISKNIVKTNYGEIQYKKIVSTIPLPELVKLIKKPASNVLNASRKLKWTSVLNINIGVQRENISDKHWIYFPEKKFSFYRVGFYHNFSKLLCPPRTSSMYIEISNLPIGQVNSQNIYKKVVNDLKIAKILKPSDKIISKLILHIPYAYVIYNKERNFALQTIQSFLRKNDIFTIGRYSKWNYSTMEEAILEGREIVKCLN